MTRIVLAYSGGLATSVAIPWLAEQGLDVITVTLDLGHGPAFKGGLRADLKAELEVARDRALAAGAVRAHVLDAREEFARDFIVPSLKADAVGEDRRPMAAALSRPLIARKLVEIAAIERASTVAHGCAGGDRDLVRIESAVRTLDPNLAIVAPARDWGMTASQQIEYATARGIHVPATGGVADTNLWRAVEQRGPAFKATDRYPAEAAYVDLAFERGVPTAVNGVSMPIVELIGNLGHIAGAHGVDSAIALHAALKELQALVTPEDLRRFAAVVGRQYADLIDRGLWFSPLREALDAFVDAADRRATGVIRLKLFKGECLPAPAPAPAALRLPVLKG